MNFSTLGFPAHSITDGKRIVARLTRGPDGRVKVKPLVAALMDDPAFLRVLARASAELLGGKKEEA